MSRQQQFKAREETILATAEQLLLDSGDGDITLDHLAEQLDLAKGTLYKHFSSKDELYLRIIIRYEEQLFEINKIDDSPSAGVARMIFQQLLNPQKAMLLNQIEERLAASVTGLNRLFGELYDIRRQRMKRSIDIASAYLQDERSSMSTRDYLSSIWALGQGGAGLLNSSFYQRYLGRRDTLRYAFIMQILELPSHYPTYAPDEHVEDSDIQELVEQIDTESEAHRNTMY
ncbi:MULTISPECIES: TetR/AcrR family transcriptional regulator [unclassified Psychrobacter]|uniref:TetR/AcrR family transcriptional regulator n=1 Tax=unclassified Psychrobacter TaxID=196806 RepID=UPI0018F79C94|nr:MULTISPECIES: TetR/AcrR family transcriptional regulator [unclassified Psychrobacter]